MADTETKTSAAFSLPTLHAVQVSLREKLVQESGGAGYVKGHELSSIKAAAAQIAGSLGGDYILIRELANAGATANMFSNTDLLKSLANANMILNLAGEREKAEPIAALLTEAVAGFVAIQARGKHTNATTTRPQSLAAVSR